jgi:ribA/ribD-fused uncharacterized protein
MKKTYPILAFVDQYRFLSNFWPCKISYGGHTYLSVEAAYQAEKCADRFDRRRFEFLGPSDAKRLGREIEIRRGWQSVKLGIMTDLVRIKFRNKALARRLKQTGTRHLEEGNWWGDKYWGVCRGEGDNKLGLILMKIREELK